MQSMMKNIVKQLTSTKRFQVVALGTTGSPVRPTSQPGMILLTGQLLEFSPGKRAARMFAGLIGYATTKRGRAGEAKARVHIQFTDFESGELLHEEDVEGVVRGHPFDTSMNFSHAFGPSANETGEHIAKQIAKVAKSNF